VAGKGVRGGPYLYQVTSIGSTYLVNQHNSSLASSDNGRSWQSLPIPTGAGGATFDPLPGVGVWAALVGFDVAERAGRIWFSSDAVHWEQRAKGLPFRKS
jgi:hypothetical protein